MPQLCSIPNCKNSVTHHDWFVSYKFPKDKGVTDLWLASLRNAGITKSFTSPSVICGEHFVGGRKTAQHSIPTIFPTMNSNGLQVFVSCVTPQEPELPLDDEDIQNLEVDVEPPDASIMGKKKSRCNCKAYYNNEMKEKIADLKNQIAQMSVENKELKKCIDKLVVANKSLKSANDMLEKKKVSREALAKYEEIVDYPNRLEYYTGFKSHEDFTALYNFVEPDSESNPSKRVNLPQNDVLPLKTQLLIVLIKLRLNLDNIDLAYRFSVPQSFIVKYWNLWIPVMHLRLSEIPTWPSPEICDKYRPTVFKESGYDIVDGILHRFEITVADSRTDQTETKKGLMALAPNGFFMFASDLVPSTLTDQEVVLGTRILDKFTEGRGVMVGPNFLLEEECEKKNLRLMYVPSLNDGNLYTHIDNVTSKINYFRIICDTYDSSSFEESSDELNSVWHICCALLNFIENYDKQV